MAHPMPIGDMQLMPISQAIYDSKDARGGVSTADNNKLEALAAHIADDKYCHHLIKNGMMETCQDPTKPIIVVPPPSTETIKYDSKNYVFALTTDPRELWDYSGHSWSNRRYCHGMVAATWSYAKG
jgi:hypothetical protein